MVEHKTDDYSDLKTAGVEWIRLEGANGMNWGPTEETPGVYDWSKQDLLVEKLVGEGFQIFWTVSSFHQDHGNIHYLPEDMAGYLKFLSAAVERYDGDGVDDAPGSPVVDYFQVENEVDGHFWEDTPENYAFLLKESIKVIREASSNAKVAIGGASIPRGYYDFYSEILAEFSDEDPFFDVMDVHWYEGVGDYAVHPLGDYPLEDLMADLREDLEGRDVEVWFTEVGTHTGSDVANKPAQSEQGQAMELVKRYVHFTGNGVARTFWHSMLEDRAYSKELMHNDFFDNMGLIYNGFSFVDGEALYNPDGVGEDLGDGVRKLGFYSHQLLAEKLAAYDEVAAVQQSDGAYIYRFDVKGAYVWVAWREGGGTISLAMPGISGVVVMDAVPDGTSGMNVDEAQYLDFFPTRIEAVEDGELVLQLGDVPVIIEAE